MKIRGTMFAEEHKKVGWPKAAWAMLLFSVMGNGMAFVFFLRYRDDFVSQGTPMFDGYLLFYSYFLFIAAVLFSAFMGYYIFSKEYQSGMWGVLLTKNISKRRIVGAKHVLFLLYFEGYLLLSMILFTLAAWYFQLDIPLADWVSLYGLIAFVFIAVAYGQLLFHIYIRNGMIASALSVLWIFLFLSRGYLPNSVAMYLPLFNFESVLSRMLGYTGYPGPIVLHVMLSSVFYMLVIFISLKHDYYGYE